MGNYHNSFLYRGLNDGSCSQSYGEGTMKVRPQDFEACAVYVWQKTKFFHSGAHAVWLVPESFNRLRYNDDSRSVPGKVLAGLLGSSTNHTFNSYLQIQQRSVGTSRGMRLFQYKRNIKEVPVRNFTFPAMKNTFFGKYFHFPALLQLSKLNCKRQGFLQ